MSLLFFIAIVLFQCCNSFYIYVCVWVFCSLFFFVFVSILLFYWDFICVLCYVNVLELTSHQLSAVKNNVLWSIFFIIFILSASINSFGSSWMNKRSNWNKQAAATTATTITKKNGYKSINNKKIEREKEKSTLNWNNCNKQTAKTIFKAWKTKLLPL